MSNLPVRSDISTLADRANTEHAAAIASAQDALRHAIEAGKALSEAKAAIGHGAFGDWLAEHFGASARTARQYMHLAEHAALLPKDQNGSALPISIRQAAKMLADEREPCKVEGDLLSEASAFAARFDAELPIYRKQLELIGQSLNKDNTIQELAFLIRECTRIQTAVAELRLRSERGLGRCLIELHALMPGVSDRELLDMLNSGAFVRACDARIAELEAAVGNGSTLSILTKLTRLDRPCESFGVTA